jgi:LacI family transcriptional regulator
MVELLDSGIRIPEDIAVAGFNNDPISHLITPNLTTIDYPAREMGEIAANALISKLGNSESASLSTIILRHNLVVRSSSLRNINNNKK